MIKIIFYTLSIYSLSTYLFIKLDVWLKFSMNKLSYNLCITLNRLGLQELLFGK